MGPVVAVIAVIGFSLIALIVQKRRLRLRRLASGLLVSYCTVLGALGAGELFFRCCYAESNTIIGLSTQNWLNRYWQTNSLGYRDREWTAPDLQGKTTIIVTGDSFTAGWGIENPVDRFSDVLASHLGDGYAVINLGVYGAATPEELDSLKNYPLKTPDVVIMQYFLNDIDYALLRVGMQPKAAPIPDWARESYLGNYLFMHFVWSTSLDPGGDRGGWDQQYAAYDNPTFWNIHRQEIEDYIDYVDSIHARLIVVIFPNLQDPVGSIAYVDRVAQVFEERGHHDILKLYDAVASWNPSDVVVSSRDAHPSVAFSHYVGDTLYKLYFASN